MRRLTIDRTQWQRGAPRNINIAGKCAAQLWMPTTREAQEAYMSTVHFTAHLGVFTDICLVNDDALLGEAEREQRLTQLFRELETEVTFVGEGRPT